MSKIIVVDVEADGEILGKYSMVCFGAVLVDKEGKLNNTFYGKLKPISTLYKPDALAISGFTREEHENFDDPEEVMINFNNWLNSLGTDTKILYSDNNQFDGAWINYYFHTYLGKNPFGFSSHRIGNIFQGWFNDPFYKWKKHRITTHTHNPVDDAKGNAEALLYLHKRGYKLF